jgi:DNA-binding NtrC family response regulator
VDSRSPSPVAREREPTLEELKRRHILTVLVEEGFRVGPAATRLGISRSSLYPRLKAMGLDIAARRRGVLNLSTLAKNEESEVGSSDEGERAHRP